MDSTSTVIGSDGRFNTSLTTPNDSELSGSELTIVPILQNIGDSQSSTANDATSNSQHVRLVLGRE